LASNHSASASSRKPKIFYGWYIVGVGFLSHVACAFHMSSTLSVFLKPLTEDLAVSRGLFSLLRSGEILIGAAMAPMVGPLVDRYGGRWLMAGGALAAGTGFVLLSQVGSFWQFLLLRWTLITIGGVFMCHMVVSVTVARWFVRKRGRAIAIASLGQGLSKVCIPVVTATLFVWVGWRWTWSTFGVVTLLLIVIPALIFMRRSPEEMGLKPDGDESAAGSAEPTAERSDDTRQQATADETVLTWREVIRTRTFWLICFIYGMANVGIAGLNLHVFAFVTDIGFSNLVAATALSIIALTQLGSTLMWGVIGERIEIRRSSKVMFLIQAFGLFGDRDDGCAARLHRFLLQHRPVVAGCCEII
jgi:MFS family permease